MLSPAFANASQICANSPCAGLGPVGEQQPLEVGVERHRARRAAGADRERLRDVVGRRDRGLPLDERRPQHARLVRDPQQREQDARRQRQRVVLDELHPSLLPGRGQQRPGELLGQRRRGLDRLVEHRLEDRAQLRVQRRVRREQALREARHDAVRARVLRPALRRVLQPHIGALQDRLAVGVTEHPVAAVERDPQHRLLLAIVRVGGVGVGQERRVVRVELHGRACLAGRWAAERGEQPGAHLRRDRQVRLVVRAERVVVERARARAGRRHRRERVLVEAERADRRHRADAVELVRDRAAADALRDRRDLPVVGLLAARGALPRDAAVERERRQRRWDGVEPRALADRLRRVVGQRVQLGRHPRLAAPAHDLRARCGRAHSVAAPGGDRELVGQLRPVAQLGEVAHQLVAQPAGLHGAVVQPPQVELLVGGRVEQRGVRAERREVREERLHEPLGGEAGVRAAVGRVDRQEDRRAVRLHARLHRQQGVAGDQPAHARPADDERLVRARPHLADAVDEHVGVALDLVHPLVQADDHDVVTGGAQRRGGALLVEGVVEIVGRVAAREALDHDQRVRQLRLRPWRDRPTRSPCSRMRR